MTDPAQLPAHLTPGPDYDRQWYVDRIKQLAALRKADPEASRYCPQCTHRAPKRAKFCGQCGMEIGVVAYDPPVPQPLQRPADPALAARFDERANEAAEALQREAAEQALVELNERSRYDNNWCGTFYRRD